MYPFRPLHTITWAKKKFTELFEENIQLLNSYLQREDKDTTIHPDVKQTIDTYIRLKNDPSFREEWAVNLLNQCLVVQIEDILKKHPVDEVTAEGGEKKDVLQAVTDNHQFPFGVNIEDVPNQL